jgi:hypothetical protein
VSRPSHTPRTRIERAVRVAAQISTALLVSAALYVVLVQLDVVRSPLDPSVRGDLELAGTADDGVRVLFVGNSFTYYNEMAALVEKLAAADEAAPRIVALTYAAPNWGLEAAAKDSGLDRLLQEVDWDVVVLQERSGLPSLAADVRTEEMDRFAYDLEARIDAAGAETVLFMTWGYEDGDRNLSGDNFADMQARVARGYWELAQSLGARVAPVGLAWAEALRRNPAVPLWRDDGRHPSKQGRTWRRASSTRCFRSALSKPTRSSATSRRTRRASSSAWRQTSSANGRCRIRNRTREPQMSDTAFRGGTKGQDSVFTQSREGENVASDETQERLKNLEEGMAVQAATQAGAQATQAAAQAGMAAAVTAGAAGFIAGMLLGVLVAKA